MRVDEGMYLFTEMMFSSHSYRNINIQTVIFLDPLSLQFVVWTWHCTLLIFWFSYNSLLTRTEKDWVAAWLDPRLETLNCNNLTIALVIWCNKLEKNQYSVKYWPFVEHEDDLVYKLGKWGSGEGSRHDLHDNRKVTLVSLQFDNIPVMVNLLVSLLAFRLK